MNSIRDWINESIPDVIMDDAAAWMALLDSERCNAADRVAFARWLDEDPQHRWAFEELSEVWAKLHTLVDVAPMLEHPKVTRIPTRLSGAAEDSRPRQRDWSALVVSLIVLLGVAVNFSTTTPSQVYRTAAGEFADLSLDDGSRIELNARSELIVTIDDAKRLLVLKAGEAVFHVAADERPFVVETERGVVAARGTAFVVERRSEDLEVAVLEGSVSVTSARPEQPLSEYDESGWRFSDESALLGPGESARLSADSLTVESTTAAILDRELSWREGVVHFDNQPLATVIAEMRRYVNINVHIADPELGQRRVTAKFRAGDVDAYVDRLLAIGSLTVERAGERWIVLRL